LKTGRQFLRVPAIVAFLLCPWVHAIADDVITNFASPVVSYQYPEDVDGEVLTNGGVQSAFISFQYLENAGPAVLTNGGALSGIISYQYPENLSFSILSAGGIMSSLDSYYFDYLATATLSGLTVSSPTAPADGTTYITATVTLRDINLVPVAGKTIIFSTDGSLANCQPKYAITDTNGHATTIITATSPGTVTVLAIDSTDGISVQQTATITFTSGSVPTPNDLSNAISELAAEASTDLTQQLSNVAIQEGQCGDFFWASTNYETAHQGVIALNFGIGGLLALIGKDDAVSEAAKSILADSGLKAGDDSIEAIMEIFSENSSSLEIFGQSIGSQNYQFSQKTIQYEQSLLDGIPPLSMNYVAGFTNDLQLRLQANNALKLILVNQEGLLLVLRSVAEFNQYDFNKYLFETANAIGAAVGTISSGPGGIGLAESLNAAESLYDYQVNQANLSSDQQSYNTAFASLFSCLNQSELIYSNTAAAFNAIARGNAPNPVTGQILNVTSQLTGPQYSINPLWLALNPLETLLTTGGRITNGTSVVTIANTSQQSAKFIVYATYSHTESLTDLGIPVSSAPYTLLLTTSTNLTQGQTADININYYDSTTAGTKGALPDAGSQVTIYVLACNGDNNQNIFNVGRSTSTLQWVPTSGLVFSSDTRVKANGIPKDASQDVYTFEDPVKSYVFQNISNQTYQAQIWVANPFAIPLQATVSQPLPTGITILSTDGQLDGSTMVWTNTIPTNGLVEESFAFKLQVTPGFQTNLPAPTLVFADTTGTNSLTLSGTAPIFSGLLPVQATEFIPVGVAGSETDLPVAVTNLTAANQSGTLTVSLADASGNVLTNYTQAIALAGNGGEVPDFSLPGTLPPGAYLLTGQLAINGGSGTVFSGTYLVSAPPLLLGANAAPSVSTNGFAMTLQGLINSNYLIEASTDLQRWTPILYLAATNTPFNLTDPDATNFSRRFYRATLP